ncbi:MAG: hypothetical protein LBU04_07600, partial [Christensenellaceae bacterium]|nr:hypothetical protein [Christensenellaceae bacterium]
CDWPIKVIIGNPPYNARSTNKYDISQYKLEVDGKTPLKEITLNSLNDDYVKFIRFAEKLIIKEGEGILAYISNNGYLDNPTFRGMRASLLRTFDEIYILNLHGNSNKKERCPDGSKDENVFDIRTGVAIIIAIKKTQNKDWAKVYYSELYGLREKKFEILESKNITYKELSIDKKTPLFLEHSFKGRDSYEECVNIKDLFTVSATGMESGNDDAAITYTKAELEKRINTIRYDLSKDGVEVKNLFGSFGRNQTAKKIRDDVLNGGAIKEIAHRPFDNRWSYYSGKSTGWLYMPTRIMYNFLQDSPSPIGKNIGLVYSRGDTTSQQFSMIFITDRVTNKSITVRPCYVAPLFLAPEGNLDWSTNFNKHVLEKLTQNLEEIPTPLEVFDYCYGVLFDPKFRKKYNEFLKRDFPRVPIIENKDQFFKYKKAGERLRLAHLMHTDIRLDLEIETEGSKNMNIEQVRYVDEKLYINKTTAIIGIPSDVYNYYIGGYQVIDKWFKGHKNEILTIEYFNHIEKIAAILKTTIEIQNELLDS